MATRPASAMFARLVNILDEHDRKKTENVERATSGLDPVTRANIMDAARLDAEFVESSVRDWASRMLASSVDRVGREPRLMPRRVFCVDAEPGSIRPPQREVVPAEYLAGAKQSYAEMIEEIDRLIVHIGSGRKGGN